MEDITEVPESPKCLGTSLTHEPQSLGCDYITQLHDDILGLILNKLPADEALRTCFLSRRWTHYWSTQVKLTFKSVELKLLPTCLTSLKELCLDRVNLADDAVQKITRNIPSLSVMHLINCNSNADLHIKIAGRNRHIRLIIDEEIGKVNRNTELYFYESRIAALEFVSSLPRFQYQVEDGTLADEIHFGLGQMSDYGRAVRVCLGGLVGEQFRMNFLNLFRAFQKAYVLSLSSWCIQTVGLELMFNYSKRRIYPSSASHVKLELCLRGVELIGIVYLLRACKRVKRLTINISKPEDFYFHDGLRRAYMFRTEIGIHDLEESRYHSSLVQLPKLEVVEFVNSSPTFEHEMQGDENFRFDEAGFLQGTECGLMALSLLKEKAKKLRKLVFVSVNGTCEVDLQNNGSCSYYPPQRPSLAP